MKKTMQKKINIDDIMAEYDLDFSIFTEMNDRLIEVYPKWTSLNKADKTVMVLYAEYQSYREVGKILGISHTTIARAIANIRNKICGRIC